MLEEVRNSSGDIYHKAALLLTRLVQGHHFASGVRRTAYASTTAFLRINGANDEVDTVANVLIGIREGFAAIEEIEAWLKGHGIRPFQRR